MKRLFLLLIVFLPPVFKPTVYRRMGYRVGKGVRIGLSFIDADSVDISNNVRIGHFNVFRRLKSLRIGSGVFIANFNEFFGNLNQGEGWTRRLTIDEDSKIMSHHFFDVSGDLSVGSDVTIGGRDSQFWTHTIRVVNGARTMVPASLRIGANSYLGARATVLFCDIPARAIVGACSVVNRSFDSVPDHYVILAGNPAAVRRTYPAATRNAQ